MNVDAAFRRIDRMMAAFGVAGTIGAFFLGGWRGSVAFVFGALVSVMNFRWLKGGVNLLAAKFAGQETAAPPRWVGLKFVLRYALLGAAGYGIFTGLRVSLPAFLAGLFVSIAAIMGEMIFELSVGKHA